MNDHTIRCSDTDRNRAVAVLRGALGRGQITLGEFDDRTQRILAAKTRGELQEPLRDLVPDPHAALFGGVQLSGGQQGGAQQGLAQVGPHNAPAQRPKENWVSRVFGGKSAVPMRSPEQATAYARSLVTGRGGTSQRTFAVFSTVKRKNWVVPARFHAQAYLGTVEIDLCSAQLSSPDTVIHAQSVLGSVIVKVPEGIRVIMDGNAVLGEFRINVERGAVPPEALPANAPILRVKGASMLAEVRVDVKRMP